MKERIFILQTIKNTVEYFVRKEKQSIKFPIFINIIVHIYTYDCKQQINKKTFKKFAFIIYLS